MLEMTYFHAELVQLSVSRSDSELEVQRYGMKINTLTVDPIMWIVNETMWKTVSKLSPNHRSLFFKSGLRKPSFQFLNFEVSSVQFGF